MQEKYVIGLDYGTESVRAVLVNVQDGNVAASADCCYPDRVIDAYLPGETNQSPPLPPDFALQNPADWLSGLKATVKQVLALTHIDPSAVIGLGIDFTSCTILPTTATGEPLSFIPSFRSNPHAWAKLWKHHAAQKQADRVNRLALDRGEPWLSLYGGKVSSEWLIPKALQIFEEAPEIYAAAARIVEGADWITWQLTGKLVRNACGAGYKATWHKTNGYPSPDFLESLHPGFGGLFFDKCPEAVVTPGSRVGQLTSAWATRLGLPPGLPIAAGIIDAHAAAIGAGVTQPGTMFLTMGTSTCHMLMAEHEVRIPGISGVVEGGIVPGYYGYEAGQAGVGDSFAWFVETCVPPAYHTEAQLRGMSLHDLLSEKAARLAPGESGLLALDWWNGCRTPLVNARLSGLLVGANLATTPEEIYRSLIEATAYGTRQIIEAFTAADVPVDRLLAGGGLTKNRFLMQLYADITGREIGVAASTEASALGAAMLASLSAGSENRGYADLTTAALHMAPPVAQSYPPQPKAARVYDRIYAEYSHLVEYFGQGVNSVMEILRDIKMETIHSGE